MGTNSENTTAINSFVRGMNTDSSYSNIQDGYYLYGLNIRNNSYNSTNDNTSSNTMGSIRPIDGYKEAFGDALKKTTSPSSEPFRISKILAATSIRQYGIVIIEDDNEEGKNWAVVRFTNKIGTSGEYNKIDDCKIIFRSYPAGDDDAYTMESDQLYGDKVSIVATWETEDNIKLYIADGKHFMKIINVAPSNDDYNLENSGNVKLYEQFPDISTKPIIFCGLTYGHLKAGAVQYSYRFYKKRGNVSQMSPPTKPIQLGIYFGGDDIINKKSKGGLYQDVINCGVNIKIPLDDYNSLMDHILIYRIFHAKNGENPEISLIYDRAVLITIDNNNKKYMLFTDVGQESLETMSLDEYNNVSGVYIIPKVIESKNDMLFAANIKDDLSTLDEIGRMFDARAFRTDSSGYVEFVNGNETIIERIDHFLEDRDRMSYEERVKYDTLDQFNPYNDINVRYGPDEDVCKYKKVGDKLYYGGLGKYIEWEFILTSVVGDYSKSDYLQIGSKHPKIDNQYKNPSKLSWLKCSNKPKTYRVYKKSKDGKGVLELAENADLSGQFEPNNDNYTYANPCVSYGMKSLRRDELYRYAIVLYNKKGEHTSALWIDDIRTPSMSEDLFLTYCSNSCSLVNSDGNEDQFTWDGVELSVFPLGIRFNVDIESFNNILKKKFGQEYDNIKITHYEIVRCHRGKSDVLTLAQGVLSRPIKRKVHPLDYTIVDDVYTPTGSLTTQLFWTGEMWLANNGYFYDDKTSFRGMPEADNFDNHKLYQFVCPEVIYTKESFNDIVEHTKMKLEPISYVFGHCGIDNYSLDREDDKTKATYEQMMREFDCAEYYDDGDYYRRLYAACNYIGSSVCGHNLALPTKAYSEDYVKKQKTGLAGDTLKSNSYDMGYYYRDVYYPKIGDSNFRNWYTNRIIMTTKSDGGTSAGDRTYLRGLQGMFIDLPYSRNRPSYYCFVPWDINKYYGVNVGGDDTAPERLHGLKKGFITYLNVNSEVVERNSWNDALKLQNKINSDHIGYTKLYEQSFSLILRKYDNPDSEGDPFDSEVQYIVDKYGLPFHYDTCDLKSSKFSYNVDSCKLFTQIEWSNLIDSLTKDNKSTYSPKYTDYVKAIGTSQFCNVVDSGTYNDTTYTLTTDKSKGWFYSDESNLDRLDDFEERGALFGTGGSCLVLNLEDDNILYKTICSQYRYTPHCDTMLNTALEELYPRYEIYNISEELDKKLLSKISNYGLIDYAYPKNILKINPDDWGKSYDKNLNSYYDDKGSAYDYIDYIYDPNKELSDQLKKRYIYRSSISGTFLCNLRQQTIPYGGYSYSARCLNTYVSFGDVYDADHKTADVFDGDCYILPFEYQSCHKTYHKDMSFTVNAGLFYAIPVETTINVAMSSGTELSRQDTNTASNIQEDPSSVMDYWVLEKPEYEYNTAYSVQPEVHSIEASDLSKDSNTLEYVDYRCYHSEIKANNENYDNWAVFKPSNFLDVDDRYGEITNLRTFNNLLIFWQQHAIGQFSVNDRSLITDESGKALTLGTGGVLSRYDYIDQKSGMVREQYCDTVSKQALYWFDDINNEIKTSNGSQIVSITKQQGVQNIMNEYSGIISPMLFFDYKHNEVVAKTLNKGEGQSIVYNENLEAITSVYTNTFKEKVLFPNGTYLIDTDGENFKINLWDVKDGISDEAIIKYVVNQNSYTTKVFDNQEIITERLVAPDQYDHFGFKWSTEFMSCEGPIKSTSREGNFRYLIPREGNASYGNRMRGKYMVCEITWPNTTEQNDLKNVSISYIITKFRQSCS